MVKNIKKQIVSVESDVVGDVAGVVDVVDVPGVVDVVDVVDAVDADVVDKESVDDLAFKFAQLVEQVNNMSTQFKDIQNNTKLMQKLYNKSLKQQTKKSNKSSVKKPPSGFAKPTNLSDEICEFVNIEKGSMLARTEVTRYINAYIKTNNLQNPVDKRTIVPDVKLRKIMNLSDDNTDTITYFNLQRYIKHHFISTLAPVVVATPATLPTSPEQ